ncbi:hypothetical protein DVB69_08795 [Sporosarcina sp. BI001-red]|nr:hypothetical protein DVB69_08795 [Sporosarcina sp. BI001-red]
MLPIKSLNALELRPVIEKLSQVSEKRRPVSEKSPLMKDSRYDLIDNEKKQQKMAHTKWAI